MRRVEIPQLELRNNVGRVLREVEAGTQFTVTVRGRPVAELGPLSDTPAPRVDCPREVLANALSNAPVDSEFFTDLAELREAEAGADSAWSSE